MSKRPGLQTRAENIHKHPGKVVTELTRKRRSPKEVAAAKAAAEQERAREEAEREALLTEVRELEDRLRNLNMDKEVRSVNVKSKLLACSCAFFT